jgi:hypothetical protein
VAESEALDQCMVARGVTAQQVAQEAPAAGDEAEETSGRAHILFVGFQVCGQVLDAPGQHCDLDFNGAGIALGTGVIRNNLLFF